MSQCSMLSNITFSDKALFYKTLSRWRPFTKNYEDSWGYIIQATRYEGHKWYDPDTESLIFFGRKSPNDATIVIPNFFAKPSYLKATVDELQFQYNVPQIILKNIDVADINTFTPYGFRLYHDHERWSTLARFDDQTYPQLLIDLENIISKKGQKYRQLRRFLKKNSHARIRQYIDSDKDAIFNIFMEKDAHLRTQGMYYASHAMYPGADLDKFVIIDDRTDDIIGFTAFSSITSKTAASVASLFKPNVGVTSIWGAYNSLLEMYKKGFKQINFGGNETKGPYNFLREKFAPVEEIRKTHLVYDSQH